MRSSHRQCSWEGDICPGFPGEASPSPASSHIRDSWDTVAEQVTHQPGLCREFTPQHEGTKATSSHPERSGTNHLPGLLAVKSCLNRSISLHLEVEREGRGPKSLCQGPGCARPGDSLIGHSAACVQETMGDTIKVKHSDRKKHKEAAYTGDS